MTEDIIGRLAHLENVLKRDTYGGMTRFFMTVLKERLSERLNELERVAITPTSSDECYTPDTGATVEPKFQEGSK